MTLGNLVVNLTGNTSRFDSSMRRSQGMVSSFASSATRWLTGIAATVAATASAWLSYRGAVQAVTAAQDQLAAERKLEAVLRSTGSDILPESVKQFAAMRQSLTNFGDEATLQGAAVLATFKSIRGDAFFRTLVAAQDMSAVLGTDLQSSILQLGKALENPAIGLTYLRRSGVSFTDSQVDMIKALQASGDLLGAQSIILQEVRSQFGGAAEATRDLWAQLGNIGGDALEGVGKLLTIIAETVNERIDIKGLASQAADWLNKLSENRRLIEQIAESMNRVYDITLKVSELTFFRMGEGSGMTRFIGFLDGINSSLEKMDEIITRVVNGWREIQGLPSLEEEAKAAADLAKAANLPAGPIMAPGGFGESFSESSVVAAIGQGFQNVMRTQADYMELISSSGFAGSAAMGKFDNLSKPSAGTESRFAGAFEKGSVEAYRAILRAGQQSPEVKLLNKIEQNTRASTDSVKPVKVIEGF